MWCTDLKTNSNKPYGLAVMKISLRPGCHYVSSAWPCLGRDPSVCPRYGICYHRGKWLFKNYSIVPQEFKQNQGQTGVFLSSKCFHHTDDSLFQGRETLSAGHSALWRVPFRIWKLLPWQECQYHGYEDMRKVTFINSTFSVQFSLLFIVSCNSNPPDKMSFSENRIAVHQT